MTNPRKIINTMTPAKAGVRKRPAGQGGAEVRKKPGGGAQVRKRQRSGPRAATKKRLPPLPWYKRLSTLPRRTQIFGGAAVALVILIVVFLFSGSPRKEAPSETPPKAAALLPGIAPESQTEQQQPAQPLRKAMTSQEEERPTISSIRFHPPQATRMDTLKAEVVPAAYANPGRIAYTYVWKVNDRKVEEAKGDTLDLSTFKKRDLVTVTVTPHDGDKAGFPVESPVIIIYGIPPSLDLQAPLKKTKVGEPHEFQLVGLHPDSDAIAFSLEAPLVPGMSIDSHTGKITWLIRPNQKGTIRFGAAVEDTDKTKVTKTFDINIE
ncbi:MAG: hypothetical protein D4R93_04630 [Deltaproteobacteria bacterium]|nr:MAG: hypothetical protein D4R93_04630 [Deltaproteobacteria bacterium]